MKFPSAAASMAAILSLVACAPSSRPSAAPEKKFEFSLSDYQLSTTAFHTDAHQKYLQDPLVFAGLPDQGVTEGKSAVVGSRVCRFYPGGRLTTVADLATLPEGVPVPFGTILPILGPPVRSDDAEHNGMFAFEDNWNWFYPTTFQGAQGLVYGADLFGLDDSLEDNRISALLYNTSGKDPEFHPILGYHYLSDPVVGRLERDRLAFQAVHQREYYLGYSRPDDMISLYLEHKPDDYARRKWQRKTPVFVTTDLVAHSQHLIFDRLLQYLEEAEFVPRLHALNDAFLARLDSRADSDPYRETFEKARLYFLTAQALLDLAPNKVEKDDGHGTLLPDYEEKDRATVLASYPEEVRQEIAKIDAQRLEASAVFQFASGATLQEDYSQYKPRGHYTKNGVLGAYFRAMMWYGRIPFVLAAEGPVAGADEMVLAMAPVGVLINDLVADDPELENQWAELFDPITELIGLSDDLGLRDVLPLWKQERGAAFGEWANSKDRVTAFIAKAHETLRAPAVAGSSVFGSPSEGEERRPPMNFRLFGQRFTWDSWIHHQVSPPRLFDRDMVRGLDVMKAFGSRTADLFLRKSDYPVMAGLEDRLNEIETRLGAEPEDFWRKTFYDQTLYLVKSQAQFEPGAGFYFTESPAWGQKAMLSAHGTWAELRHDTILYVKQSYAERAGDGDFMPTFRTEPIPEPVHYLEPNVPFWQGSVLAVQKLYTVLERHQLVDEETASTLSRLRELLVRAEAIAQEEAADLPVPAEEVAWIPKIPAELVHLVLVHIGHGEQLNNDELKMALVADVYTNAELEQVLETAVGIPYRLYVPLNDGQGGKRIAVGYTFSYYEFSHPMNDRMTDEAWKALVYQDSPDLAPYRPFWTEGLELPPEPPKK